ncbi:MAG: hypothetical protein IJ228_01050 [Succinivibrio sp.]|nr:hypothetical protein [Succinivibrio sp.]
MALRRNIERQHKELFPKLVKWLGALGVMLALVIGGLLVYFNGENVKSPLLKQLTERSGLPFNAENVEFSALYPNTLKLHQVSLGQSTVEELYIEYDVKSLLSGKRLIIEDLYARGIKMSPQDFLELKKSKLGFSELELKRVNLENIPFSVGELQAARANFDLHEVRLGADGALRSAAGKVVIYEGSFCGLFFKNLSAAFEQHSRALSLNDLEVELLGGTVSADLRVDELSSKVVFDRLSVNGTVLKDSLLKVKLPYEIVVPNAQLSRVTVLGAEEDLQFAPLSGQLLNFNLKDGALSLLFKGRAGAISRPSLQLTADHNELTISLDEQGFSFKGSGNIFEGNYEAEFLYQKAQSLLELRSLKLKNARLEFDRNLARRVQEMLDTVEVRNSSFENLEIISHIDELPLTVQSLSGSAVGFRYVKDEGIKGAPAGLVDLSVKNLLYADQALTRLRLTGSLSEELATLNVPELTLGNSSLSLAYSGSGLGGHGYLIARARDFDLADINSSLLPGHLFSGKIDLDIDLQGEGQGALPGLFASMQGHAVLNGKDILISKLGLDLLNGGPKQDYELDLAALLSALEAGDLGMERAVLRADFAGQSAQLKADLGLTTSNLALRGTLSLPEVEIDAKAHLVSLPKDSMTRVDIKGSLSEPRFVIKALSRGEERPGIFMPEGKSSAPAEGNQNKTDESREPPAQPRSVTLPR